MIQSGIEMIITASNTRDCFRDCIGRTVRAVAVLSFSMTAEDPSLKKYSMIFRMSSSPKA